MSDILAVILLSFIGGMCLTLSFIIWRANHPKEGK